jgi:hypothetical protein
MKRGMQQKSEVITTDSRSTANGNSTRRIAGFRVNHTLSITPSMAGSGSLANTLGITRGTAVWSNLTLSGMFHQSTTEPFHRQRISSIPSPGAYLTRNSCMGLANLLALIHSVCDTAAVHLLIVMLQHYLRPRFCCPQATLSLTKKWQTHE